MVLGLAVVTALIGIALIVVALTSDWFGGQVAGPTSPNAVVSADGWEWQNPLPQGNGINDVWGSSQSDVFAVNLFGTILHYDGISWSSMNSGTTEALYGIWGTSSSDVFAVGDNGTILHYAGDVS